MQVQQVYYKREGKEKIFQNTRLNEKKNILASKSPTADQQHTLTIITWFFTETHSI